MEEGFGREEEEEENGLLRRRQSTHGRPIDLGFDSESRSAY